MKEFEEDGWRPKIFFDDHGTSCFKVENKVSWAFNNIYLSNSSSFLSSTGRRDV